ncbi:protein DDI1 like protein 2-like protein [Dinothrombium tinctorium]|uniref:Protein DDI1 like protein 2-like protein n=1 Tax=Dinothrombium tinctorium TaxID=1965070 RepID=A0A443RG07_9ACAR|nr:protein DDI1 like protein 2-like protein [Dinothrombium tinctorium]
MGNKTSKQVVPGEDWRRQTLKINSALVAFIADECPLVKQALFAGNERIKNQIVNEFNAINSNDHFNDIQDVLRYMEKMRRERIAYLDSISANRFHKVPKINFSCIQARVNDKLAITYFDTGCGVSCMTKQTAIKLGLCNQIKINKHEMLSGSGNSPLIIGNLFKISLQIDHFVFQVDFIVIDKADFDFVLIGADFMLKHKVKLNYRYGELFIPQHAINKKCSKFMPTDFKPTEFAIDCFNAPRGVGFSTLDIVGQSSIFINVKINNRNIRATIDSGADSSKISHSAADRLNVLKYADFENSRISQGLGCVIAIGKIPPIPVEFDQQTILFIPFEVLNTNDLEIAIFGSDFLTYYGCEIDYESMCLHIALDSMKSYELFDKQSQSSEYRIISPSQASSSIESFWQVGEGRAKSIANKAEANELPVTSETKTDSVSIATIAL